MFQINFSEYLRKEEKRIGIPKQDNCLRSKWICCPFCLGSSDKGHCDYCHGAKRLIVISTRNKIEVKSSEGETLYSKRREIDF